MPELIIVCGRSFAGKTMLAGALARSFGFLEVAVDATKALLFGGGVDDGALTDADWARIYRETHALIGRHIATAHRAELLTIHVDTPVPVTRARLLANQ